MDSEYTPAQFLKLLSIPSSSEYELVFQSLRRATGEPLFWEAPGDEAEYIAELRIGDVKSPRSIGLVFSKYGNLCFMYLPDEPIIPTSLVESILGNCGWILISSDAAKIVLYPTTGETVHDRFFNYT